MMGVIFKLKAELKKDIVKLLEDFCKRNFLRR